MSYASELPRNKMDSGELLKTNSGRLEALLRHVRVYGSNIWNVHSELARERCPVQVCL
jgi:hypothetical protein